MIAAIYARKSTVHRGRLGDATVVCLDAVP